MKNINQKQKILKNKITKQEGFATRAFKTSYQIRNKKKSTVFQYGKLMQNKLE